MKLWCDADTPYGKMYLHGKRGLTDKELLAIVLKTGIKDKSCLQLSAEVLNSVGNNFSNLAKLSISDLTKIKGVGVSKAMSIIAAIEIGWRRVSADEGNIVKVASSKDIHNIFHPLIGDLLHEEFWILFLKRNHAIISKKKISSGGTSGTVVDPKNVFIAAMESKASAIVLCHNHPSGNMKPSDSDIKLTKNLVQLGDMLEMKVIDHLIIAENRYFSFVDEGML